MIDLIVRLDGVPLREAFERAAALAGLRALKPDECVPQRPRSGWQVAQEAQGRTWKRYLRALRDRDWARAHFVYFAGKHGLYHPSTVFAAEVLAASYDAVLVAEYAYEVSGEVER